MAACCALMGCKKEDKLTNVNKQGEYFNCKIDGKYRTFKQSRYINHDALNAGKQMGPCAAI
jgi:hypothetical protein